MTVRTDISFDWNSSPRVITVASPSTTVSVQDLLDTCRVIEGEATNLVYDSIISAGGKEDLGGGSAVGITATLLNAVIAFEARGGPSYTQCIVNGGNVVAVDDSDVSISAIYPTAFTQILTTASSSATAISVDSGSGLTDNQAQQLIDARKFALLAMLNN